MAPIGYYNSEEATSLVFSHYRLPRFLHPETHSKKIKLLYHLILNSETLPDMLFYRLTSPTLFITLLCFCLGSSAGSCMPCHKPNRRDTFWDSSFSTRGLYNPKITSPTNNTIWIIGSDVVVTWNLHDMPENISNPKGKLMLGYLRDGNDDEHLLVEHPLAEGFDIKRGFVSIKCPKVDVDPAKRYIVVLFGDSGNRSPPFSIRQ